MRAVDGSVESSLRQSDMAIKMIHISLWKILLTMR